MLKKMCLEAGISGALTTFLEIMDSLEYFKQVIHRHKYSYSNTRSKLFSRKLAKQFLLGTY